MEENKVLVIENGSLISLKFWLSKQPIPGMKSRERTRFIDAITPQIKDLDTWREALVKEYAEVDEKGEFILVEDQYERKNYDLTDENRKIVEEKLGTKLSEKFSMPIGPEIEKSYHFVKGFVMNTATEFEGKQAEEYDKWCAAFENDRPTKPVEENKPTE